MEKINLLESKIDPSKKIKKSGLNNLKPAFLKKTKAKEKMKEQGFESFSDFKIEDIKIISIKKSSWDASENMDKFRLAIAADPEFVQKIEGRAMINSPVLGDKAVSIDFNVYIGIDKFGGIAFDCFWKKTGERGMPMNFDDPGLPSYVNERGKEIGIDGPKEEIWTRDDLSGRQRLVHVTSPVRKEFYKFSNKLEEYLRDYIKERFSPEETIKKRFAHTSFEVGSEISGKTEKETKQEIAMGLEAGRLDGKYLYLMGADKKWLEIVRSEQYQFTNKELSIIKENGDEIAEQINPVFFDLGCGDGGKARAVFTEKKDKKGLEYHPVDISPRMVFEAANNIPEITIQGEIFDFTRPFANKIPTDKAVTIALLGSTLGNWNKSGQEKIMKNISEATKSNDNTMIGVQLNYNFAEILKIYQSPEVSSLLQPVLKKLGLKDDEAEIYIEGDEQTQTIKANIKILCNCVARIGNIEVFLEEGKTINMIVSHKYEILEMEELAHAVGLKIKKSFLDAGNSYGVFILEKTKN